MARKMVSRLQLSLLVLVILPVAADAGSCDAHFTFDGDLQDTGGNGYNGQMIGKEGTSATPQFADGKYGKALQLDGASAMRSFIDLHFDTCPQVTVSAWIQVAGMGRKGVQYLMSTGSGSGPGIRVSGTNLTLSGSANGIIRRNAIRANAGWMFVAGVYDYEKGTYTLYSRNRGVDKEMGASRKAPEEAIWVGAFNDGLAGPATGILIDDLRIQGKALSANEIQSLRKSTPSIGAGGQIVSPGLTPQLPTAMPGISEGLPGTTPMINPDAVPDSPTGILAGGASDDPDSGIVLLDPPETADPNVLDPNLTPPEDLPGEQLQEDITAAQESTPIIPAKPAFVCDTPGSGSVLATSYGSLPNDFVKAVRQARECRLPIQAIELTQKGEWVIAAGDQVAYNKTLRSEIAQEIDEYRDAGTNIDLIDISPFGAWLIVAGNSFAESGLPSRARSKVSGAIASGAGINSFSVGPGSPSHWVMVNGRGTISGQNIPKKLLHAMSQFPVSGRVGRKVEFAPGGGWSLFTTDTWFVTEDMKSIVISNYRSNQVAKRQIDHVLFYDGQSNRMIISNGQEANGSGTSAWRVENRFTVAGTMTTDNIWKRMAAHQITGVSIALVVDNRIAWSRGYGLREANDPESNVFVDTIFDAASVSKSVSAAGILQLVEQGKISLGMDGILQQLEPLFKGGIGPNRERKRFKDGVRPEESSLAQILQHCAGITYSGGGTGVYKYDVGADLPNTVQAILGDAPAKSSKRVVRSYNDGVRHDYSGANFVLIQGLIDLHGGSFLNHMSKLLSSLGMTNSSFVSPPSVYGTDRFARGHESGTMLDYKTYGELAPASLTTTAADLSKFVVAMNRGGGSILLSKTVDVFLGRDSVSDYTGVDYAGSTGCAQPGNMKLGINRSGSGLSEQFWHNGDHVGYHAKMFGLPGREMGAVVIMTSAGNDANKFYGELRTNINTVFVNIENAR